MCDDTIKKKILNNCIQDIGETCKKEAMMDNQLRFEHVQSKPLE